MTESWEPTQTTVDAATPSGDGEREWSATTLDDAASATTLDQPADPFVAIQLPPGLAADYELLERLGGGGEAVVHRARDLRVGRDVAIKVYLGAVPEARFEIGDETHRRYFPHEHAVDLYERRSEAGTYVEVMEYCPAGTLADYVAGRQLGHDEIVAVVAEIAAAIDAMGTWRHGDIKPQNILVRSRSPLDLVLTDFGLTQNLGERARVTTVGHGTRLYQPPGTGHSARKSDDWWALGIIVAELAAGQHPFAGLFGASFNEEVLRDFLIHNPVPTDHLADHRVRRLVQGLLIRNPDERFGYDEVRVWLDGDLPPLPADVVAASPAALPPLNFQGTLYRDYASLAEAIRTSPRCSEAGGGVTLRAIIGWTEGTPLHRQARNIASNQSTLKGRLTACLLAALLAGDGRAVFSGVDLTSPEGLAEAGGNPELLAEMLENHVLERFSEILDNSQLARIAQTWRDHYERAYRLVPDFNRGGSVVPTILAHAWRLAINPAYAAELHAAADAAADTKDIELADWLQPLLEARDSPAADVALLVSMPRAEVIIAAKQEERRREQAAEQQRLEQERERQREEEERQRQEREREAVQRAEFRARRKRSNLLGLSWRVAILQVSWLIWISLRGWARGDSLAEMVPAVVAVGIATLAGVIALVAWIAAEDWFSPGTVGVLNAVGFLAGTVETALTPAHEGFWWPFSLLRVLGVGAIPYLYAPLISLLLTLGYVLVISKRAPRRRIHVRYQNAYWAPLFLPGLALVPDVALGFFTSGSSPQAMGVWLTELSELAVLLATVALAALPLVRFSEGLSVVLAVGCLALTTILIAVRFADDTHLMLAEVAQWIWGTFHIQPKPGTLGWWLTARPIGMGLTLELIILAFAYLCLAYVRFYKERNAT